MTPPMSTTGEHSRVGISESFRQAREASGRSHQALASLLGTSAGASGDLESDDDELFICYSPADIRLLAEAVGQAPTALLHCPCAGPAISGDELIALIRTQQPERRESLAQFEDHVGWRLRDLLGSADALLAGVTVDGLQWLCAALAVDWRRVIAGL